MFHHRKSYGFSLIELMVALVITSLAAIIMLQMLNVSERQRQITSGASDAQTNGAVAFDQLEREIRAAGFGTSDLIENCNPATTFTYYDNGGGAPTGLNGFTSPVQIQDSSTNPAGADANTDAIFIPMPASNFAPGFVAARVALTEVGMPTPDVAVPVGSTYGCDVGGFLIMVQPTALPPAVVGAPPAGSCTLMQISAVNGLNIEHATQAAPNFNPAAGHQIANNWPAYKFSPDPAQNAFGICMPPPTNQTGPLTFRVNNQRLVAVNQAGVNPVATNIVSMQAAYGLAVGNARISPPQPPTGAWANPAVFTQAQSRQIKAIYLSVVARSAEYEKPEPGGACATTTATAGWSTWADHNAAVTALADWQCYRYKVFETVIPIRNVILSGV